MQRALRKSLGFLDGLGFRLVMLLSVALLPLGLISLVQTLNLTRQAQSGVELTLVSKTESIAAAERAILQTAIGTSSALATMVTQTLDQPQQCSENLRRLVEANGLFTFAGFVRMDATVGCSSRPFEGDLGNSKAYQQFVANPVLQFMSLERGAVSGKKVVVLMAPVHKNDALLGYVVISIASTLFRPDTSWLEGPAAAQAVTVNARGQMLTADLSYEEADQLLPADLTQWALSGVDRKVIRGKARNGEDRVFTLVPTIPNLAYTIGTWSPRDSGLGGWMSAASAVLFPMAMWLVSLAVAYFAVYRLVIRHVRNLRSQMRRFALGDRATAPPVLTEAPAEIQDVSQTFHNLARILIRDEEALEKSIGEKTILLKEIHHRVKNNLQLIASIISMQSRMLDDPGAKRVLRSVQDRVASLATIYRNLYQAEQLVSVEADRLMADILAQMANATVAPGSNLKITTALEPLPLIPDQAVPLSLLATEAFTNAVKYAGRPQDGSAPVVNVRLRRLPSDRVELLIENSIEPGKTAKHESTGLGSQLIEAFAMQLDAETRIGPSPDGRNWQLQLTFDVDQRIEMTPEDNRAAVLTSAPRKRPSA